MAARIRLYELARELGLSNKETLDLCVALGIGVKSHSSSIEDAQADRVRRKADREGLRRAVQPEEPAHAEPAAALPSPNAIRSGDSRRLVTSTGGDHGELGSRPAPIRSSEPAPSFGQPSAPPAAPATPAPMAPAAAAPSPPPAPPAPRPPGPDVSAPRIPPPPPAQVSAPAPAAAAGPPPAPATAPATAPAPAPAPAQQPRPAPPQSRPSPGPSAGGPSGGGPAAPARPAHGGSGGGPGSGQGASAGSPASAAPAQAPRPAPAPAAGPGGGPGGGQAVPAAPGGAPRGASGRPVPPPPGGPMRSPTGRPIPPPPGLRSASGRPIPPPPGGPPRPAGRPGGPPQGGAGRPSGGPSGRPSGGPGGRPGGGPGGAGAGRPGAPGARPGGAPGGRPGGGPGGGGYGRPAGGPGGGGGYGRPGGGPGGGGPGGRPGGGPGGRPGGPGQGRRPPQRRRRRRRSFEELEPTQATTYTRSDAPVPEGEVVIERGASAQELGPKLNRTAADVIRFLLQQGEMITATQSLSDDMIELFAAEIGADVLLVDPGQEQEVAFRSMLGDEEDDEDDLRPRPPVITVMGHVDHGKTLLLDRLRETNVVAGEAGGITQHIGAYQIEKEGRLITFIDTPGHEAFTAMRARGADATDIAVLVVAADDGVMPQTVEALNHAKVAEVPIVVAVNKIDREDSDPNRVRQQLSEQGLVPEEWGGDTIMVEISALQNLGIEDLLEQLLVVADVEELVANPEGRAWGVVLEANLDVGRGPVASVLVQRGTLRVGDPIVAGAAWGRVRALIDDKGENIKEAPPSTPVQVLGLSEVPDAGDEFRVAPDDKTARTVAEARGYRRRLRAQRTERHVPAAHGAVRLEDIFEQIQRGETANLNLILKADVHGSLEAVTESLRKVEREDVKLVFVHRAVGGITENDVQLATASNATIIGFNVRPDRKARELAETADVDIRTYQIIYQLIEDIEKAMVGLLRPEYEEVVTGDAEVREIFRVPRIGSIAGCYVTNGVITRGSKVRFLREGVVIWTGTIQSLKRFKDDAREVAAGYECGIGLSDFQDLRRGDVIETYEEREIPRT